MNSAKDIKEVADLVETMIGFVNISLKEMVNELSTGKKTLLNIQEVLFEYNMKLKDN